MIVSQMVDAGLAGVVGLLVGSFLNVVIYRLPRMLEQQWAAECAELAGKAAEPAPAEFNLMRPPSRKPCPTITTATGSPRTGSFWSSWRRCRSCCRVRWSSARTRMAATRW